MPRAAAAPRAPPGLVAFSRCQGALRWGQSSVLLLTGGRHGLAVPQAKQLVATKVASPEPHGSITGQCRANTLPRWPLLPLQRRDVCPYEEKNPLLGMVSSASLPCMNTGCNRMKQVFYRLPLSCLPSQGYFSVSPGLCKSPLETPLSFLLNHSPPLLSLPAQTS